MKDNRQWELAIDNGAMGKNKNATLWEVALVKSLAWGLTLKISEFSLAVYFHGSWI